MFINISWAEFGSFLFNLWYVVLIAGCSNLSNVRTLLNSTLPLHYPTYDWTLSKPTSITTPRWNVAGKSPSPSALELIGVGRCVGRRLAYGGALLVDGGRGCTCTPFIWKVTSLITAPRIAPNQGTASKRRNYFWMTGE